MENSNSTTNEQNYQLSFKGKGREYFGVVIVNWFLIVITLGMYYPWAKEKQLKYLYNSTLLNGDSFSFNGTGKEMFVGFIKTILIVGVIFSIPVILAQLQYPFVGVLITYLLLFILIPIAVHGSLRYRMSRSSWRGIRFGYRGHKKEFVLNFYLWVLLTILTLGVYGAWMAINLRKYVIQNIRLGTIEFDYKGSGGDYFLLNIKDYFLTIITFGIYAFWYKKDLFAYFVDNISAKHNGEELALTSTATGFGFLKLSVGNFFIMIFSLGLAFPWVMTRTLGYVSQNIAIAGNINLDEIHQTEEEYKDAMGEDMGDFLDLNII